MRQVSDKSADGLPEAVAPFRGPQQPKHLIVFSLRSCRKITGLIRSESVRSTANAALTIGPAYFVKPDVDLEEMQRAKAPEIDTALQARLGTSPGSSVQAASSPARMRCADRLAHSGGRSLNSRARAEAGISRRNGRTHYSPEFKAMAGRLHVEEGSARAGSESGSGFRDQRQKLAAG